MERIDIDSPGNITHNTIPKWLEDLNVSPEGIVFYLIAWKCKAKHTFTITREEFLVGMTVLRYGSPRYFKMIWLIPISQCGLKRKPPSEAPYAPQRNHPVVHKPSIR